MFTLHFTQVKSPIASSSFSVNFLTNTARESILNSLKYSLTPGLAQASQEQDLERAQQLNRQITELYQSGRYGEAIPLVEQLLTIREEVLGPEHVDTIASLNDLAWFYNSVSRYAEAASLWQRVLTFYRQVGDRAGEGAALWNMGATYTDQKLYDQALPNLQQAFVIFRDMGVLATQEAVAKAIHEVLAAIRQQGNPAEYQGQCQATAEAMGVAVTQWCEGL